MAPVDFNYFLQQKYAQLQQQADATTSNASSTAIQASANANAANAAAGLDATKAKVLPGTAAADIGLQNAQANLYGQQASVVRPTAEANIGATIAGTRGTDATTAMTILNGVNDPATGKVANGVDPSAPYLARVFGTGYQGYRLPGDTGTPPVARPAVPRLPTITRGSGY